MIEPNENKLFFPIEIKGYKKCSKDMYRSFYHDLITNVGFDFR